MHTEVCDMNIILYIGIETAKICLSLLHETNIGEVAHCQIKMLVFRDHQIELISILSIDHP